MGLLAGGLADGSVCLWDPSAIVAKAEGRQPLLAKMQKHTGAVRCCYLVLHDVQT